YYKGTSIFNKHNQHWLPITKQSKKAKMNYKKSVFLSKNFKKQVSSEHGGNHKASRHSMLTRSLVLLL
ncbi:MAG: hypothetical protein VSS75_019370, partial [Candidatus Parabeggiatoa sp.]|nr:hypothetical protein [Candidatus Parabeggiatoa sp.]